MRSVRVRITLAATAVVAVALAAASWAFVGAVRRDLLDKQRAQDKRRVQTVAQELAKGAPPDLALAAPRATGAEVGVVKIYKDGRVVATNKPGVVTGSVTGAGVAAGSFDVFNASVAAPKGGLFFVQSETPLDGIERAVDSLVGNMKVGVPLLVLLVAGLAWVVAGRALRPIEAIRAEVESITHTTMSRRVPTTGAGDEVDRLASTMNGMLDRLERSAERQRRFVSDASHELRSPLAAMRTQLEVAARRPPGAVPATDWQAVARAALADGERLEGIVADLLELARLDESEAGAPAGAVDLDDVVLDEVSRVHTAVTIDTTGVSAARVAGDARRLGVVVRNLLCNAGRHARSTVAVSVRSSDSLAVLVVDDDGPGVPEEDRSRVFEPFTRLAEARSREDGGVGLGLSLVQRVVALHGGTVTVGDAPGLGGARFEVRLPLAPVGRMADADRPSGDCTTVTIASKMGR